MRAHVKRPNFLFAYPMNGVILAVLMVVFGALVIAFVGGFGGRRCGAPRRYSPNKPMEGYEQKVFRRDPVDRTYKLPFVQPERSPLTPYLAPAIDPGALIKEKQRAPFAKSEVKSILEAVVTKINRLNEGLDLALVSFDNVSKWVDAHATAMYEADVQVHSVSLAFSSRLSVKVEVGASGKMYVRSLSVHNALPDASTIAPSNTGDLYATFVPALQVPISWK